jgi:hypothetical protein
MRDPIGCQLDHFYDVDGIPEMPGRSEILSPVVATDGGAGALCSWGFLVMVRLSLI